MWSPDLAGRPGPRYRAIADALADDVVSGCLAAGERLPTHRELAHRLQVTVGTVSRAYAEAERRGLIAATVGRGTFVRDSEAGPPAGTRSLPEVATAWRLPTDAGGPWSQRPANAEDERLDLSLNYPVPAPVGEALLEGLRGMQDAALLGTIGGYQPANGIRAHREAGVAWLRHLGVLADAEEILVVPGCQGGLSVCFLALCRPGDVVLHEDLTWPGFHATAASLGVRTKGLAMDENGLLPDALEAACRDDHPKLLYTMPTLHNPTAVVMPEDRRRAVAAIAARHGLIVVEDDVYGFLLDAPPPSIRTLLPDLCIYVTSLSKAVAPGLRIGWLAAPVALVPRLAAAIRTSMLMTSSVAAELATRTIATGSAARAATAQRSETQARQRLAAEKLAGFDFRSHPSAFHGWLAVPPPWQCDDFCSALQARGVVVTPGTAFAGAGRTCPEAELRVRLCLCAIADRQRLALALDLVAEVAQGGAPSRLPVV